jgi:hypothetical protein
MKPAWAPVALGVLLLSACGGSTPSASPHLVLVRNDTDDAVLVTTGPSLSPHRVSCAASATLALQGAGPWTITVRRASGAVIGTIPAATPGFELDVNASGLVARAAGGNHGASVHPPTCLHSAAAAP